MITNNLEQFTIDSLKNKFLLIDDTFTIISLIRSYSENISIGDRDTRVGRDTYKTCPPRYLWLDNDGSRWCFSCNNLEKRTEEISLVEFTRNLEYDQSYKKGFEIGKTFGKYIENHLNKKYESIENQINDMYERRNG